MSQIIAMAYYIYSAELPCSVLRGRCYSFFRPCRLIIIASTPDSLDSENWTRDFRVGLDLRHCNLVRSNVVLNWETLS